MKLPDNKLIFFQFPCIALGFQIAPEFKFPDERCGNKTRHCANRKRNRFNVDQSTCTLVWCYKIWNTKWININKSLNSQWLEKILNSAIIYISARYRKPTSIFRHLADIGPIWECLLGSYSRVFLKSDR